MKQTAAEKTRKIQQQHNSSSMTQASSSRNKNQKHTATDYA
jgi:hypothetical protein